MNSLFPGKLGSATSAGQFPPAPGALTSLPVNPDIPMAGGDVRERGLFKGGIFSGDPEERSKAIAAAFQRMERDNAPVAPSIAPKPRGAAQGANSELSDAVAHLLAARLGGITR